MTSITSTRSALIFRLALAALASVLLAACGDSGEQADVAPTAPQTAASATAAAGELSVADVTDRINAAWGGVNALRVTSTSGPVPTQSGSSTSVSEGSYTVEEWSAPNNRRITEIFNDEVVNEQIYVDGVIYMKGVFVSTAVAPEVGSETWITLDKNVIPADTPVGNRVAYLTRESGSPFAKMAPDVLSQTVSDSGKVQVGDRSCTLYAFGDADGTGDEIRYEIALDGNDLPCQVVQRGGGYQNSSVYEFNADDIQIVAPDAGTPVSGTPEG